MEEPVEDPVLAYHLGPGGRTEWLTARIYQRHIRRGELRDRGYSERVKKHVGSLDRVSTTEAYGKYDPSSLDHDHVGHIIAWILGGPTDRLYNFFPSSPTANRAFWEQFEQPILNFFTTNDNTSWVWIHFEFIYNFPDCNRPTGIKVAWEYSDGRMGDTVINNCD